MAIVKAEEQLKQPKEKIRRSFNISKDISVTLTLIGLIGLWQLSTIVFKIPTYLLPSPHEISIRFVSEFSLLFHHMTITLFEVILGFAFSVFVGLPIAILIVYSRYFANSFYPILVAVQCIPMIAIAPLLVIWFGFGLTTKVILAALISFFPIVINAVVGMKSLDKEMLYLARSLKATEWEIFFYFRLPKALPQLFGGFKVGITLAVVGAIVAEFVASEKGLGYLQLLANARLDTTMVFCSLVMLAAMGIALFYFVHLLERLMMPWYHGNRQEDAS
jgi:NitT/TauT family transport system permease protein